MSRTTFTARLLNLALVPTARSRRRPEAAWDTAVAEVEAGTGFSVSGDEQFAADLGYLLRCLAETEKLNPFGWVAGLQDVKTRLENRLRIRHLIEAHPRIAEEEIEDPVFVVGLPRTATSLTHKILAASDKHRGPLLWEMLRTDLPRSEAETEKFIKTVESSLKLLVRLAPSWEVIHPVRARMPEESIFIVPHDTFQPALRADMPGYRAWLRERDYLPDFEYLKQALQVLQHGRERKRWILKHPGHLNHMDSIRKVFPGARFVWTHRDPVTVIGSSCSLIETSWSLYQKRPDLHEIGELTLNLNAESIERGRAARLGLPSDAIIDVPYHRLNSDPNTEVPRLYEALGAEWTEKDAANLAGVLARPVTDRRHEYGLSRYGLDPQKVEDAFGDYTRLVDAFNSR
jgi:hypothetical protein